MAHSNTSRENCKVKSLVQTTREKVTFPVNPVIPAATTHLFKNFGIPISLRTFQFVVIHTVKDFSVVNEAEVDVFVELPCFFDAPTDVGNLISDSSAFSKPA